MLINGNGVSALVNKLNSCTGVGTKAFDNGNKGRMAGTIMDEEKKIESVFPWVKNFNDMCRTSVGNKSIKSLENLLTVYLQHVSIDVKNCYMRPNRAAKLKKCMNGALLFFHMFYQDIREPMEHSFYLSKMTDLISMYLDMEIKASRRQKETTKKVVSRLTSFLYIFLDNSELHILDAVLKAKLVTNVNRELCIPVLEKLMSSLRMSPLYELLYVRCVLVFKLWKKMVKDAEEKKRITKLAVQRLAVPTNFLDKSKLLNDILPIIPKSKKNISLFFMKAKFNVKSSCKAFLKMCKDSQPVEDKPLFFREHHGVPPVGDKNDDVGGGCNSNLFNSLWSSISVTESNLTECSQWKTSGEVDKEDVFAKKKQKSQDKKKKKVKNKLKAQKSNAGLGDVIKKKKKLKNKSFLGNAISMLDDIATDRTSSQRKGEKKKKKKLNISEEAASKTSENGTEPQVHEQVSNEESLVVVKTENIVQDFCTTVPEENSAEPKELRLNQIHEMDNIEVKETLEEITLPSITLPVVIEKTKAETLPDTPEQKKQVIVGFETERLDTQDLVPINSLGVDGYDNAIAYEFGALQISSENPVEQENSVNQLDSSNTSTKETSPDSVESVNRVVGVIVPPSSNNLFMDSLVNTSHKFLPTSVVESGTVPSVANRAQVASSTVMVESQDYVYEAADSRREIVPFEFDQTTKLKDPVQEEIYVVPIPKECSGGVDKDCFRSCVQDELDDETFVALQPQDTRQPRPEELEVLAINEQHMLSFPTNIFATGNSDLFFDVLNGEVPVSDLDSVNREVLSEVSALEYSFNNSDEATEMDSPPMERMDKNEKLLLASMMKDLKYKKTIGQFGNEQQWIQNVGHKLVLDNCFLTSSSRYAGKTVRNISESQLHVSNILRDDVDIGDDDEKDEDDEDDEDEDIKVDDYDEEDGKQNDLTDESSYDFNSSSASSSPRVKVDSGSYRGIVSDAVKLSPTSSAILSFGGKRAPSRFQIDNKCVSNIDTVSAKASTIKQLNVNLKCGEGMIQVEKKQSRTSSKTPSKSGRSSNRTHSAGATSSVFPDVVRDAQSSTEKHIKKSGSKLTNQRSSPRGSSINGNNATGKSVKLGVYHSVPFVNGTGCVPPSIPYPTIPTPATMSKAQLGFRQYVNCTCSQCYANHLAYLTCYNNSQQEGNRYGQVPNMLYRNSGTRAEDEELLRRIEASLADSKYRNLNLESESDVFDSKNKSNLDSSLPLKKRKTLTVIEQNKVETGDVSQSTQAESFPSYPSRPMISIAELELNRTLLNRVQEDVSKCVRTSFDNMPKYTEYHNSNSFYDNSLQSNNFTKRMPQAQYSQCHQYTSGQPELPKFSPVCKVEDPDGILFSSDVSHTDSYSEGRKSVNCKESVNSKGSNCNGITNHIQIHNSGYCGRTFKTPAQLKEIVPNDVYKASAQLKDGLKTPMQMKEMVSVDVAKSNMCMPMPALIPLPCDVPAERISVSQSMNRAGSVKQDIARSPTSNTVNIFERQNILDLSKQALVEQVSRQSSDRKRNTISDSRSKSSKRSKRDTVIQNPETDYRKKYNSHIPR